MNKTNILSCFLASYPGRSLSFLCPSHLMHSLYDCIGGQPSVTIFCVFLQQRYQVDLKWRKLEKFETDRGKAESTGGEGWPQK